MDMNDLLQTNLGPMTPEQIADEMTYRWYANQRRMYALSAQRLANFIGDVPGAQMEARFREEEADRAAKARIETMGLKPENPLWVPMMNRPGLGER